MKSCVNTLNYGRDSLSFDFPTRKDIVDLNRYHILSTGGHYQGAENLLNPGSLQWVLEAIQYPLFGVELYPTLVEKAAALSWNIAAGHVFHDGNKRTSISALMVFLRVNGYSIEATHDELVQVALDVASGREAGLSLDDFAQWIRSRLQLYSES